MMLGLQRLHCRRVRHALWDYVAERLSEGPMETVERHIAACASCRREAEAMRQAQDLLAACLQDPIPAPRSDWSALKARLQTEAYPVSHAITERRVVQNRMHRTDRLMATRRNRWVHCVSRSGAVACTLLLAAFGYRSLNSASLPHLQRTNTKEPFVSIEPKDDSPKLSARMTDSSAAYDEPTEGWDLLYPGSVAADGPDPVRGRQAAAQNSMVQVAHLEPRPAIADNLHLSRRNSSETRNRERSMHFRPYKPRPEDALPQSDSIEDRYATSNVVPIPNSSNGIYAMPSLTPVQYDGEAPY